MFDEIRADEEYEEWAKSNEIEIRYANTTKPQESYDDIEAYFLEQERIEQAKQKEQAAQAAQAAQSTPQTTSVQTNPSPYILRKDGIADGLSCMIAQYFETLPQEEIKEAKERFLYLKSKNPEQVTMESNDLVWYLKFKYENITIMERFFKVKDNGEYVAMKSRTLIVPNDVDIQDGKVTPEQKKLIEAQNHTGNYLQTLEEKMKRVESGYLDRNRDIEH